MGAIIRSAECAGAHGIIIPKRRSAGLTAIVDKASAGAAEHALVARVPNIPAAIGELKEKGLWIYGTAADGSSDLWNTDFTGPMSGKKNTEVKEVACGDIVAIGKMDWKTGDTVCDPKNEVELPPVELPEPCYSMPSLNWP